MSSNSILNVCYNLPSIIERHRLLTIGISISSTNSLSSIFSSSRRFYYGGSWKNQRRLQNPTISESMPTYEFVRQDGKFKKKTLVYVCGFGATGSLGLSKYYRPDRKSEDDLRHNEAITPTFRSLPVFKSSDNISDISCGYGFTIIAAQLQNTTHTALGFGLNTHSQIGYHAPREGYPLEIVATPSPIFLPTKHPVTQVSCGRSHSLILDKSGSVYSLGNNCLGQCGRPINEKETYFGSKMVHKIDNIPTNIKQIECGQDHSMFLTEDGKLYSCGWGGDGQTGLGHYNNQSSPSIVKGDIEGVNVVKVSSCADTVLALDDNGNLFGWGNSEYSQFRLLARDESEQFCTPRHLDLINVPGKIVDIAAGGTMCAIINDKGQVFVWGFGILGKGPIVEHSAKPTLIPESLFGTNVYDPDSKVVKIYAGLSQFAAITNRGDLYTWGKNRGCALGFNHSQNQYFPMRVNMNLAHVEKISFGVDHTCAMVRKIC